MLPIEAKYDMAPRPDQYEPVIDEMLGFMPEGRNMNIGMDDQFANIFDYMLILTQRANNVNKAIIHADVTQFHAALANGCVPIAPDHQLIDRFMATLSARELLWAIRNLLQAGGYTGSGLEELLIDGRINLQSPTFISIKQGIPAILAEVIFDEGLTVDPNLIPSMKALFFARLQELVLRSLPSDVADAMAGIDLGAIYAQLPDLDMVLDLDIGKLTNYINLVRLIKDAMILSANAYPLIWTSHPQQVAGTLRLINEIGGDMTVQNNTSGKITNSAQMNFRKKRAQDAQEAKRASAEVDSAEGVES